MRRVKDVAGGALGLDRSWSEMSEPMQNRMSAVPFRRSLGLPAMDAAFGLSVAVVVGLTRGFTGDALILILLSLLLPLGLWLAGRYRRGSAVFGERWLDDLPAMAAIATALAWGGDLAVSAGSSGGDLVGIVLWWLLVVPALLAGRKLSRVVASPERALIVGAGEVGRRVADRICSHPEYDVELVGFLDDDPPGGPAHPLRMLGGTGDLESIVRAHNVDRVIFAFSLLPEEELLPLVRRCSDLSVQVDIVPRLFEVTAHRPLISMVEGLPLTTLPSPRPAPGANVAKRAFDLALAGLALVAFLPGLLAIAAAVWLGDRGPIFYRQRRIGRDGRTFDMLKFRTMRVGSDALHQRMAVEAGAKGSLKLRDDHRITRVGRVLRRTSLDELPQLLNVVRGDMSLVGPRPLPLYEGEDLSGWAISRHEMRPGLTGLWQVLGRSDIAFEERLRLDWLYVRNWSFALDLRLLVRTIGAVRSGRGAF